MTMAEALGILNRMKHGQCDTWFYDGDRVWGSSYALLPSDALALAEKYQREDGPRASGSS